MVSVNYQMGSVNKYADRFREVREQLGFTQAKLAERLFVSQNYIAQIESGRKTAPSMPLVNALESLAAEFDRDHNQSIAANLKKPVKEYRESGSRDSFIREDAPQSSRAVVAARYPHDARSPSTRADVEAYLRILIEAAESSGNPNAWPVLHDRLRKRFPLDEWQEIPE